MARLPESDPHAHARNRALYLGLDIGSTTVKVVVLDEHDKVIHAQMVDEITHEPDYDAALKALG